MKHVVSLNQGNLEVKHCQILLSYEFITSCETDSILCVCGGWREKYISDTWIINTGHKNPQRNP